MRVVRQCRMRPFVSEARALGVAAHRHAVVREVQLQCGDRPLILARTIIPFETLSGVHRRLSSLGTRPLGDIIFSSPDLRRAKMEIAEVSEWCDEIADTVDSEVPVWGRRTLYELAGRRLLVCEFFLPSVLAL